MYYADMATIIPRARSGALAQTRFGEIGTGASPAHFESDSRI